MSDLTIVGIGTSAGGLESLQMFFQNMLKEPDCAFVIIQHLSPDFKSFMPEILSRSTSLKVEMAENATKIVKNTVYLLPPKKNILVSNGKVVLQERNPNHQIPNKPIDLFFHSLAQDVGPNAVAVVLSGTGSDGSLGIVTIYEAGGYVIVESPERAKFDGMPNNAIGTRKVHDITTADKMMGLIKNHMVNLTENPKGGKKTLLDTKLRSSSAERQQILLLLQERYHVDFSQYKMGTIDRRMSRRVQNLKVGSLGQYLDYISQNADELNSLYYELLIGVSSFFRDKESFQFLANEVVPEICRKKEKSERRIWVPGCASGEEAYSIAILLYDFCLRNNIIPQFKVFASDIDDKLISIAGEAYYDADALAEVPGNIVENYFLKAEDNKYIVIPEVRRRVVFARHNLLRDPPFTKLDLVSCRNLLIYFDLEAQQQALSLLHFGLQDDGFLFLGSSESLGRYEIGFKVKDFKAKIFQKIKNQSLPRTLQYQFDRNSHSYHAPYKVKPKKSSLSNGIENQVSIAAENLLQKFVPPGVLVTDSLEVMHLYGESGQFLHLRPGVLSTNLKDLLGKTLAANIAVSILRVKKERKEIFSSDVSIEDYQKTKIQSFTVQPIFDREDELLSIFLVIFNEKIWESRRENRVKRKGGTSREEEDKIRFLERELQDSRESLQSTIEELETTNEELQSTNEELLSSNEELQSTNEELHSVNEEIYTVNAEFQLKIEELTQLKEDERNLLESSEIGVIFLDSNLKIRRFTPNISDLFNFLPQDVGRSFSHFANSFRVPQIMDLIGKVITDGDTIEKEISLGSNGWFLMTIRLFNSQRENVVRGILITLVNSDQLRQLKKISDVAFDASEKGYLLVDQTGVICNVNASLLKMFQYDQESELIGQKIEILIPARYHSHHERLFAEYLMKPTKRNMSLDRVIMGCDRNGKEFTLEIMLFPIKENDSVMILAVLSEMSMHELEEKRLIDIRDRLQVSNKSLEEFAYVLSHDLQAPVRHMNHYMDVLEEEVPDLSEEAKKTLTSMRISSRKMRDMTEGLLLLAKVEKQELSREKINLSLIINDCLEMFSGENAEFIVGEMPPVLVDRALVSQLFQNLISNSLKFIDKDVKPKIEIGSRKDNGTQIDAFFVKDNGIGIHPKDQKSIFKMFSRTKKGTAFDGAGIGLATCERIVKRHQGKIWVESHLGKGTTFFFTLEGESS